MRPVQGDAIFVYGTLLSTAGHHLGGFLRDRARLIGRGSIQARLYVIEEVDADGVNHYPGALPSPFAEDRVYGELYELLDPGTLLPELDRFEACSPDWPEPHEFMLRRLDARLEDGASATVWTYLYTWDVSRARAIPSGRFEMEMPGAR